jgi:hypothetical protein
MRRWYPHRQIFARAHGRFHRQLAVGHELVKLSLGLNPTTPALG